MYIQNNLQNLGRRYLAHNQHLPEMWELERKAIQWFIMNVWKRSSEILNDVIWKSNKK